jgi:predicted amidohydrolase
MIVAAVQYEPAYRDPAVNLQRVEELLAPVDADLIVLPELFSTGYFFRTAEELRPLAEALDGPTIGALHAMADRKGATLVAGFAELAEGRLFNSAAILRPDRSPAVYRKTHLFYREKQVFAPGDTGFQVLDCRTRGGVDFRLGTMICFDWYFPEAARALALAGADIIAHPSNLVRKDCPRSMPIRALENHVFTVTANRTGTEENGGETLTFIGQSLICDPTGEVLTGAARTGESVLLATINPHAARDRQITSENHLFADRRPEFYERLVT